MSASRDLSLLQEEVTHRGRDFQPGLLGEALWQTDSPSCTRTGTALLEQGSSPACHVGAVPLCHRPAVPG